MRIARRITNYKNILDELDYKFESDIRSKKLYFLPDYLKVHNLQGNEHSLGYLPLLIAFNKNSNSTPIRLVQTPNRAAPAKRKFISDNTINNTQDKEESVDDNDDDRPKNAFSYNDTIRDYELNLLGPTKITINHLLTISPSYADIKDGFGRIILNPETALSALIFIYKNKKDGLPTLNLDNAVKNKGGEPILYQAVYSSSSYGTKDLPKIFEYSLSKVTHFYDKNYDEKDKITEVRLQMVNEILCSAYVDDIGIHEF